MHSSSVMGVRYLSEQCAEVFARRPEVYMIDEVAFEPKSKLIAATSLLITEYDELFDRYQNGRLANDADFSACTHIKRLDHRRLYPRKPSFPERLDERALRAHFSNAQRRGLRYIAVVERTFSGDGTVSREQYVVKSRTIDDVLRVLRDKGLRPDGRTASLTCLFDTASGNTFEEQARMTHAQMLGTNFDARALQAYQLYVVKAAQKDAAPARKGIFGKIFGR